MKQKPVVTYQLVLLLKKTITLQIGALGKFTFPAGKYVYTGSAKKNFDQRIKRHFKKKKALRWHIDYLTSHRFVKIIEVKKFAEDECHINQQSPGKTIVPGFGSSDCRKKCGAHLKYLGE